MSNIYPKGFAQRTDEFEKAQTTKQEVYQFLKDTMEEASEKAFKALGIECTEKHAGEYGDGMTYGMGSGEGGKCNIKVGSKTNSYLEKQISYGGKRMFVEASFQIDGRNDMLHMIYTTTEKAVFQGHQEMKGGFFVNEDIHMSLADMTKFKKEMKKILEDAAEKEAQYLVNSKIGVDDRIATDVTQSVVESIVNSNEDDFLATMDKMFESAGIADEEKQKEDDLILSKLREEEETEAEVNEIDEVEGEESVDEITASGGGAGAGAYLTPAFGSKIQKRKISRADAPFDTPVNESQDFDERFKNTPYYQRMMNDELRGQGNVRLVQEKDEKGDSFWTVVDTSNLNRNHIMGTMGMDGVEVNSKEEEELSKGHGQKHGGGKKKKMNESVEKPLITETEKRDNEYANEYMQIDESVRKRYKPQRQKTQEEINSRWKRLTEFGKNETIKAFENKADEFQSPAPKPEPKPLNESQMKELSRNTNLADGSIVDGRKIVAVTGKRNRTYLMFEDDYQNTEKAFCFDFTTGMLVGNPNFGK